MTFCCVHVGDVYEADGSAAVHAVFDEWDHAIIVCDECKQRVEETPRSPDQASGPFFPGVLEADPDAFCHLCFADWMLRANGIEITDLLRARQSTT